MVKKGKKEAEAPSKDTVRYKRCESPLSKPSEPLCHAHCETRPTNSVTASPCPHTQQFEPLAVEGKTPATAVLLLSSPEEDILVKACEAIHTFADKGEADL